jgi:hypothetical protein
MVRGRGTLRELANLREGSRCTKILVHFYVYCTVAEDPKSRELLKMEVQNATNENGSYCIIDHDIAAVILYCHESTVTVRHNDHTR